MSLKFELSPSELENDGEKYAYVPMGEPVQPSEWHFQLWDAALRNIEENEKMKTND